MHNFFKYDTDKVGIALQTCDTPVLNKVFRDTINQYHSYVKYKDSPCRNMRYLAYEMPSGNLVGAIGLSSASLNVSVFDKYIGWDKATKFRNLNKTANNSRFCLIKSNMTIQNVASMTLKQLRIVGARDWKLKYGNPLVLLQTFVEFERNSEYNGSCSRGGSCYLADNWILVGKTAGTSIKKAPLSLWKKETSQRGELARKDPKAAIEKYGQWCGGKEYKITKSKQKLVLVRPLVPNWKKQLLA